MVYFIPCVLDRFWLVWLYTTDYDAPSASMVRLEFRTQSVVQNRVYAVSPRVSCSDGGSPSWEHLECDDDISKQTPSCNSGVAEKSLLRPRHTVKHYCMKNALRIITIIIITTTIIITYVSSVSSSYSFFFFELTSVKPLVQFSLETDLSLRVF